MMRVKAALFDLDGTIADSRGAIRRTINHTLEVHGYAPLTADEVKGLIGVPLSQILMLRAPKERIREMMEYYREHYVKNSIKDETPYAGMIGLIEWLKGRGIMVGVVTTKSDREAIEVVGFLGLAPSVDVIIGDNDARNLKPHPEPVLDACRALSIRPPEAVMIGDTFADILAGKAAGCRASIGVLWGNGTKESLEEAGADHLLSSAKELKSVMETLITVE